jgi:hypothetical protein
MRTAVLADEANWPAFRESVHAALAHLHDPPDLERHALAPLAHAARARRDATPGRALREALTRAIGQIDPADGRADSGSRPYRLMKARYVDGEPIASVRDRLTIGRSEYFREHARGLDAVATILRREWSGGSVEEASAGAPRGRLPRPTTSFVGREADVAAVQALLGDGRMVTLTGTGGVGKTRLALRVAEEAAIGAGDRWFVDLSGADASADLARVVGGALGLREGRGQAPTEVLVAHLRSRAGLLVLDNCEHLADQSARLAASLVEGCPELRLLTTSREVLRVAGEVVYTVGPLALPAPETADAADLLASEAVRLFAERARSVLPGFRVVEQNARSVARICRRLDGVPLALELAAARLRVLSVGQIESRLDDSLRLLDAGERTARPRHQTLRGMVDWSLDLLGEAELSLFRRLAVFAGG